MELPTDLPATETELFWIWLNKEGILCTKYKKDVVVTIPALAETYSAINSIIGNKKVCNLVDISNRTDTNRTIREYAMEENVKFMLAQAILTDSLLTTFIANMTIALRNTALPVKMFTSETAAKEWLKHYLD